MRISEWIAVAYFAYLVVTGWAVALPAGRRARITLIGAVSVTTIGTLASLSPTGFTALARDWAPGIYLLVGYWLSGLFFVAPDRALEARLVEMDRRLFASAPVSALVDRAPRVVLEYLELTYLCCYAVIPAGVATLYLAGRFADVDRFWTTVLAAEFTCYGVLPWIQTRPPRDFERDWLMDRRRLWFRRLNLAVLGTASIRVNTLPSGHAAGSTATALAVGASLPLAGAAFGVVAASIAMASVLGRYHYALDAALGAIVACLAFALSGIV